MPDLPAAYVDHFRSPRGQGRLEGATHTGRAVDAVCGDELELDLRVEDGTVADARFRVRGCSGSIAAGSALTTLVVGRPARADAVGRADLDAALGGIPPSRRHALRLAVAALAAAL